MRPDQLITKIYGKQRFSSRKRKHPEPAYTNHQLRSWIVMQPNWEELFIRWQDSGYDKNLTPSIDRLDDYKPYTFDNIRLVTWHDNNQSHYEDRRNRINNKKCMKIYHYDISNNLIAKYESAVDAAKAIGISKSMVSMIVNGKRSPKGYRLIKENKCLDMGRQHN